MMVTKDDTWEALKEGPIYADWETQTPVQVWVVDHVAFVHHALEIEPFEGFSGLVWVLVEAARVSRSGSGISVDFWKRGCTGWFPPGNAMLSKLTRDSASSNQNKV